MNEMTNTKKYFLQRAILVSIIAVVFALWAIEKAYNTNHVLGLLFTAIVLLAAAYEGRVNRKNGIKIFKISKDGYPQGLIHDDEREAQQAAVASFISGRIVIIWLALNLAFAIYATNFHREWISLFNLTAFVILGAGTILIQQWSYFFSFNHLNK